MADIHAVHGYAPEFIDFPERVQENWRWVWGLYAFDHGEPKRLANLIRCGDVIPPELRPAIADAIAGKRKVKAKGRDKLALSIDDRMELALRVSVAMGMSKGNETYGLGREGRWIDELADARGTEVIQEKRKMQAYRREGIMRVADRFGISADTLKKILREIRELAEKYPHV